MRIKQKLTLAPYLAIFILSGCNNSEELEPKNETKVATSSSKEAFYIPSYELTKLKNLAKNGDVSAAVKVADFYDYSRADSKEAINWYLIAANHGDIESIMIVSNYYELKTGKDNCLTALSWMEKANTLASDEQKGEFQIKYLINQLKLRCKKQN